MADDDWQPVTGDDWQSVGEQQPSTAEDIVKSTGAGLGQAVTGLAGLPGDIAEYGARGIDWGIQKVGKLTGIDVGSPREPQAPTYGSEAAQRGAEDLLQLPEGFYEPQTPEGRAAKRVGEFLPTVIGGPGTLAARVARRAIVPGVIGHGVEEATGSEAAGDIAGLAAGLKFGLKRTKYATPTYKELEDHGDKLFKSQIVKDVRINPTAVEGELGTILSDLEKTIDPELMKGTVSRLGKERALHATSPPGAMSALTKVKPSPKADVTIDDLNTLRKDLSRIAGDYSAARLGEDRMAASIAIGRIDEFLGNLNQNSVTAGDINRALPILKEARDTWAAKSRMEMVDKKIVSAALRAGSTYSGQNLENAIRQNLRRIIDPDSPAGAKLRRGWSKEELARAEDIVRGSLSSNALRMIGNKLAGPHGIAGGALIGAEGLIRGDMKTAGAGFLLPTVGYGLKEIGNVRTYRRAQELKDVLAQRAPLTQKWRQEGRMVPLGALPTTLGTATYVTGAGGFKKGGRVTKTFRYQEGGAISDNQQAANPYAGKTLGEVLDFGSQTAAFSPAEGVTIDPGGAATPESVSQLMAAYGNSLPLRQSSLTSAGPEGGFFPGDPQYGGGINPAAYYRGQQWGGGGPPPAGIANPSTNNWRLLPQGYNRPGFVMRAGHVTDINAARQGAPAGLVDAYKGTLPMWPVYSGHSYGAGYPAARAGYAFFPGQVEIDTMPEMYGNLGMATARGGRIKGKKGLPSIGR